MSGGVWMVTSHPLWSDSGYAINVRATLRALGPHSLAGVVAVVPARLAYSRACREWRRNFFSATGVAVKTLACPPDLGHTWLRWVADRIVRHRVRAHLRRVGAKLVHARGIRAGYLAAGQGMPTMLLDVRGDIEAEARLEALECPSARASRLVKWSELETEEAVRRAAGFCVVSDGMLSWLRRRGSLAGRPVAVIPCSVHVGEFNVRDAYECAEDLVVVYVGGVQWYQSPERIVRTFGRIAAASPVPVRAWVIAPDRHADLRRLLRENRVVGVVETLAHEDVRRRLCEADVGIVPRSVDPVNAVACPTKIGEYLSAGVPVLVGAGVGQWAKRLESARVGVALNEEGALGAEAQDLLSEVCAHRADYARRCRHVADSEWSWDLAAPKLRGMYRLLEDGGGE
jgi:glycosyltransferase involved in cell wall biosynthesis